jgi:hypothetical protein
MRTQQETYWSSVHPFFEKWCLQFCFRHQVWLKMYTTRLILPYVFRDWRERRRSTGTDVRCFVRSIFCRCVVEALQRAAQGANPSFTNCWRISGKRKARAFPDLRGAVDRGTRVADALNLEYLIKGL